METVDDREWAARGKTLVQEWLEEEGENISSIINRNGTFNATSPALVPALPAYIAYTSFVLFSLVLAVGVIGNVLVILVLISYKSMRTSTNLFLLNLSIADLLVLIICCPNAMVEMYMRRDIWVMGEAMCKLVPFIGKKIFGVQKFRFCPLLSPRAYCVAYVRPNYTRHHCRKILRGLSSLTRWKDLDKREGRIGLSRLLASLCDPYLSIAGNCQLQGRPGDPDLHN